MEVGLFLDSTWSCVKVRDFWIDLCDLMKVKISLRFFSLKVFSFGTNTRKILRNDLGCSWRVYCSNLEVWLLTTVCGCTCVSLICSSGFTLHLLFPTLVFKSKKEGSRLSFCLIKMEWVRLTYQDSFIILLLWLSLHFLINIIVGNNMLYLLICEGNCRKCPKVTQWLCRTFL